MKHLATFLLLLSAVGSRAQSIPNPGFESNCNFDLTGWNWFCTSPDYYYTDGHNSCYALLLPTSDDNSPCYSSGQLIGMHTLMSGVQAGVPYQLTLWENMSGPDISSDVGMFAMPSGQTPTSFGEGVGLQAWPVGIGNPSFQWIQDFIPFTIPVQYAGMDFYFFIEYSASPDPIPGTKMFDDIAITDLSTGIGERSAISLRAYPNPAVDLLTIQLDEVPISVNVVDATGRTFSLPTFHRIGLALRMDVSSVPPGLCVMLVKTASGTRTVRFIKA